MYSCTCHVVTACKLLLAVTTTVVAATRQNGNRPEYQSGYPQPATGCRRAQTPVGSDDDHTARETFERARERGGRETRVGRSSRASSMQAKIAKSSWLARSTCTYSGGMARWPGCGSYLVPLFAIRTPPYVIHATRIACGIICMHA